MPEYAPRAAAPPSQALLWTPAGTVDGQERSRSAALDGLYSARAANWSDGYERRVRAPRLSVVIPALNEARNLPLVLRVIPAWVHEVIVVDGASTDGTAEAAQRALPGVQVIRQGGRGKGDALIAGFGASTGDAIVALDADGSTDPAELIHFMRGLASPGVDFVKGSRRLPGAGSEDLTRFRSAGNVALTRTVNALFGTSYSDLCYGYFGFWRRHLETLDLSCTGFEVETLIALRAAQAQLSVAEIASVERPRVHGQSNLRPIRDGTRVLSTILQERFRPPSPVRVDQRQSAGPPAGS
ncbi:glycosyltransferase family 2 protein [Paraconexibacter sp. AEG42_29]